MKIKDAIILGAGMYIGYTVVKAIDEGLGKILHESGIEQKIRTKLNINTVEPEKAEEKVIMGFRAE